MTTLDHKIEGEKEHKLVDEVPSELDFEEVTPIEFKGMTLVCHMKGRKKKEEELSIYK